MTLGVGVVENGRFLNDATGQVKVSEGTHPLTLYVPNPTTLQAGDSVRLWVRSNGTLIAGPIVQY